MSTGISWKQAMVLFTDINRFQLKTNHGLCSLMSTGFIWKQAMVHVHWCQQVSAENKLWFMFIDDRYQLKTSHGSYSLMSTGNNWKQAMVHVHWRQVIAENKPRFMFTDDNSYSWKQAMVYVHWRQVITENKPWFVFNDVDRYQLNTSHGFGQTWWTGDMTKPLQFASFYGRQESSCGPITR